MQRTIVVVGFVLIVGSLYWRSEAVTAGVAIGALAAWLNYRWVRRIVAGALALAADGGRGSAGLRLALEFAVKSGALVALVYYVVRHTQVNVPGLVVGLSAVVVAVVVELLRTGGFGNDR